MEGISFCPLKLPLTFATISRHDPGLPRDLVGSDVLGVMTVPCEMLMTLLAFIPLR
jgi:hypothetical protein